VIPFHHALDDTHGPEAELPVHHSHEEVKGVSLASLVPLKSSSWRQWNERATL
jgi:hypothetical protein